MNSTWQLLAQGMILFTQQVDELVPLMYHINYDVIIVKDDYDVISQ